MLPADLKPEKFTGYPPEARKLAVNNVSALQRLPLTFLPSLLREMIDYDFKFPVERRAVERELATIASLSSEQLKDWFQGFVQIRLSSQLENLDWINAPAQFVEQLSAISGALINSMRFAWQRWVTRTGCGLPHRPSHRRSRDSALRSSARE